MSYVVSTEVDYTGCATRDLLRIMRRHECDALSKMKRATFCDVAGIPVRSYNRIIYQEMAFVSLNTADRICLALGLDINMHLTIIPSGHTRAAERMARDEFWVQGITPSKTQLKTRAAALRGLRENVLADFSPPLAAA